MFAGTEMSLVFYSGDNWSTWEIINNEYVGSAVVAIAVNDNYIFIAASHGVFRRPLSEIGITDVNIE